MLDFIYDESGKPFALKYTNGTADPVIYYYVLNLQGDVVKLITESGTEAASYTYTAWGEILTSSGTMASINPLRYRGYYYDTETGFYYLQSRYYDPVLHRFINADDAEYSTMSAYSTNDTNLFTYCGNNPVNRADDGGQFWSLLIKAAVGVVTQYVSDVVENIKDGKTGWDALKPTSSVGEYVAAGVTAMIPGSSIGSSLVRSATTEVIVATEKAIKGEEVSFSDSLINVFENTISDYGANWVSDKITNKIKSFAPINYSSYAGKQYKKYADITKEEIYNKMRRSGKINDFACGAVEFIIGVIS